MRTDDLYRANALSFVPRKPVFFSSVDTQKKQLVETASVELRCLPDRADPPAVLRRGMQVAKLRSAEEQIFAGSHSLFPTVRSTIRSENLLPNRFTDQCRICPLR